jgi:hypothetical protein
MMQPVLPAMKGSFGPRSVLRTAQVPHFEDRELDPVDIDNTVNMWYNWISEMERFHFEVNG